MPVPSWPNNSGFFGSLDKLTSIDPQRPEYNIFTTTSFSSGSEN